MNRYAAIDLGTNTFHIIIVEIVDNKINVIFRKRHFVKLARNNFIQIDKEAKKISISVLKEFKQTLDIYNAKTYKAYATSMFRRAKDGDEFAKELERKTQVKIDIIDGTKEGELTFYGAKMSGALNKGYNLIMDIGGGSVEFILATKHKIIFQKSYQIGILELFHRFSKNEPFSSKSLEEIQHFLLSTTPELISKIKEFKVNTLVGTAGSFEVLKSIAPPTTNDCLFQIKPKDFIDFYNSISNTTYKQRLRFKEIPEDRKKLIVYAFTLIKFALHISAPSKINITSYSMKEGMIYEMTTLKY